jgi:hypothetical protein
VPACRGVRGRRDPPLIWPLYTGGDLQTRQANRSWTIGNYSDAWISKRRRPQTSLPGMCSHCGARLSIYRRADETRCAPCIAANHHTP